MFVRGRGGVPFSVMGKRRWSFVGYVKEEVVLCLLCERGGGSLFVMGKRRWSFVGYVKEEVVLCLLWGRGGGPLLVGGKRKCSFGWLTSLTPSCLRRGTGGDLDTKRWGEEGDYTYRYIVNSRMTLALK